MASIPVVLCIDVEPDDREMAEGAARDWLGFEESFGYFRALRPRLEAATDAPVRYSWFFRADPQVEHVYGNAAWALERYAAEIKALGDDGDEIGLHTHAWRWDAPAGRWLADHGDQEWVNYCVRSSFEAYRRAVGRSCRSFRFGDRWMSNDTMALLEELGVRVDLTLEPGLRAAPSLFEGEHYTGSLPDYTVIPRLPYQPARGDYRRRAQSRQSDLWVVPVSTGREEGPRAARFRRLKNIARACGIVSTQAKRDGVSTLNLCLNPTRFARVADGVLALLPRPYFAPVVRSEVAITPHHRANMERNVEYFFDTRFRFISSPESIALIARG